MSLNLPGKIIVINADANNASGPTGAPSNITMHTPRWVEPNYLEMGVAKHPPTSGVWSGSAFEWVWPNTPTPKREMQRAHQSGHGRECTGVHVAKWAFPSNHAREYTQVVVAKGEWAWSNT